MNAEIQTFNFDALTLRTLTDEAGDPWFVAKDACDMLGLSNVGQALARLDDDEKNSITLHDGTPGTPTKAIVSESGLYSLILASRKPQAKEFKRWITHEVLPTIRKHGAYMTQQTLDEAPTSPDFLIRDAAKIPSNSGVPISEKRLREWMTANDWIYKHNGHVHKARHQNGRHEIRFPPTVQITRKGLALLHKRLGETRLDETLGTTTH